MTLRGLKIESWLTRRRAIGAAALLGVVAVALLACLIGGRRGAAVPRVDTAQADAEVAGFSGDELEMLVTGYCNCGKCCGWRKKWFLFGRPVYSHGKMKGSPKKVGVTASGAVAAKGTIAADPSVYSFGTRMAIPGYGLGTVQDTGGAIKGAHIDIWFPSHAAAIAWGARKVKVKVKR